MSSAPDWVPKVVNALQRGGDAYRDAAEIIASAMATDPFPNQKQVATYINRSESWVSCLLSWHRAGCPEGGVFGPEIAARRARVSTSKFEDWRNWPVFKDPPLTERDANELVGAAQELTRVFTGRFIRTVSALTRSAMTRAYRWLPEEQRRDTLEKLAIELEQSIAASRAALDEVGFALEDLTESPHRDDDEEAA